MTLPNRTRLAKRKLEIQEVRKEKQTETSKKHDKRCHETSNDKKNNPAAKLKPQINKTNEDLLDQMDLTKQLNEALLEEVKENDIAIAKLEEKEKKHVKIIEDLKQKMSILEANNSERKVSDLKDKYDALQVQNDKNVKLIGELKKRINLFETANCIKDTCSIETQTLYDDENGLEFPCKECVFVATCEDELRFHGDNEHDTEESIEFKYCCKICEHKTNDMGELMMHRKILHPRTIRRCKFFAKGACSFDENDC